MTVRAHSFKFKVGSEPPRLVLNLYQRCAPRCSWTLAVPIPGMSEGPFQTRKSPARRHRDPDSIPGPGRIGKRGFPVSRFPPNRESGPESLPDSRRPDSRPNRESGERELELGAHRTWASQAGPRNLPRATGTAAAADVRWRPEISISRIKGSIWPPGSCLVLTKDEHPRLPDFRPNRESGIP